MTLDEIGSLLALAIGVFPNMQEKDMEPTLKSWQMMLSDIPYNTAKQALIKVLSTAKFFPTVAEIRSAAAEITNPQTETAIDAWGQVKSAIHKYGYSRPEEAYASMSPEVAKLVKRFGWYEICTSNTDDEPILRAQFRKAYEGQVQREKELAVLPTEIRNLITSTTKQLGSGLRLVSGD